MHTLIKILPVFSLLLAVSISGIAQNNYTRKAINFSTSNYDEIAPVILGNKIVFCSNRPVSGPKLTTDMEGRNFFKIVESVKTSESGWSKQKMFDESISGNFHNGPVSFNKKGDYMVFSRTMDRRSSKNNESKFGLYFAENKNGNWGNIREFEYNDKDSNTIEPSFNSDATILYFSSNRTGGYGGFDLYSSRYVNGKWTAPENLGPRINTTKNELYPFIHQSGRLYFSSNGQENKMGGYDLYYSFFINGKWISPILLPGPFNTKKNDYTYFADSSYENILSTSERQSKDIFRFIPPKSLKFPGFVDIQKINTYCYVFFEENTVELDTTLYLYEWNLGDKNKVRALRAKHCYAGPGDYSISLNVIDKLTKEVLFNQAEYELNVEKIVQAFITCPDTIKVGKEEEYSGLESYFKDTKAGLYFWDFGDGIGKNNGAVVKYKYTIPGTYTIKLGVIEEMEDKRSKKVSPKEFYSAKTIVVREN
jgi:hypothetical protein